MNSNIPDTLHIQVIDSPEALRTWASSVRRLSFHSTTERFEFKMKEFSNQENEHISRTVNSYHNACGCSFGSFLMSMTLVGVIGIYFFRGNTIQSIGWIEILTCIGYTLIGALIGKITGMVYARLKLIRYANTILEKLDYPQTMNAHFLNA